MKSSNVDKNSAEKLANLLRLLADRLEEDPDTVIAFLENGLAVKSSSKKRSAKERKPPAKKSSPAKKKRSTPKKSTITKKSASILDPLKYLVENKESADALQKRLGRCTIQELQAVITKYARDPSNKTKGSKSKAPFIAHIVDVTVTRLNRGRSFE